MAASTVPLVSETIMTHLLTDGAAFVFDTVIANAFGRAATILQRTEDLGARMQTRGLVVLALRGVARQLETITRGFSG